MLSEWPARETHARPGAHLAHVGLRIGLPLAVAFAFLLLWHAGVRFSGSDLFPTPLEVARGIIELGQRGLLLKYVVASLFRVSWGFTLAVLIGVPLGLLLGWYARAFQAFNPLIQIFRPISPIAWIPLAILWFGVTDMAPIFLIFLASVFPITVSAIAAVQNMQPVYLRAAQNFGLSRGELFRQVILRASLPQIITGIRIALGVAWLVVVAAEMIAVNSGLGYLIIDARNAGKRYDLVVAGMVMIGLIGLVLDLLVRQLEKFDEVRWGYAKR
ncbi:MAG: ABC transporter permease [Chthoniobacterales bacterium]|jgi:NitT/TauT family transport system permease protein|nr:ABC transporter permease [Chthoniobacterales bacterium]MBA3761921.1 ABC transporter permease [Chthoniobacterales bacterium]